MIKKIVRSAFHYFGLEIQRLSNTLPENIVKDTSSNMFSGLARAKKNGINPSTIIDIGAAQGNWTKSTMSIWPNAHYCLVEPLQERQGELQAFAKNNSKISLVNAAMGKEKGKVLFSVSKDLDGSGVNGIYANGNTRTVAMTSVNDIILEKKLPSPYLLKLDTHGFELPIFEGSKPILPKTEMLVVECYGIRIQPHALLFWEICEWLHKEGFMLVDIVDIMRRPSDQVFWQCDALFIRKEHDIFNKYTYL